MTYIPDPNADVGHIWVLQSVLLTLARNFAGLVLGAQSDRAQVQTIDAIRPVSGLESLLAALEDRPVGAASHAQAQKQYRDGSTDHWVLLILVETRRSVLVHVLVVWESTLMMSRYVKMMAM